jgi:hypothetical protein
LFIIWPNGLIVAPDKDQKQSPFSYLGQLIEGCAICPPKIEIHKDNLKTLNDFQKLLGDINWLHPALKLTTCELSPLFKILQGDTQPSSPRYLTLEGCMALSKVEQDIHNSQRTRVDYSQTTQLLVLPTASLPTGVLWQTRSTRVATFTSPPAGVITSYHKMVAKLIAMGLSHTIQLLGLYPSLIIVPFTKEQQAWLWRTDTMWQNALANFTRQLGEHLTSSKRLNFASQHAFIFFLTISERIPCLRLL